MPSLHPIDFKKETFLSFLPAEKVFIPELQRPFSWNDSQIQDFVKDVMQLVMLRSSGQVAKLEHFFGTLVLQSTLDPRGNAIIDGQQRLTAVSLTLGLLKAEMVRLIEVIRAAGGQQVDGLVGRLSGHIQQLDGCLFCPPDVNNVIRSRLLPSPEISKTFDSLIRGGDGNIDSETLGPAFKLRSCAQTLRKNLISPDGFYIGQENAKKVDHLLFVKEAVLESLLFVSVITQSGSSSYDLFESLNATGEPLNALDLLKVWAMSSSVGHPNSPEISRILRKLATPTTESEDPTEYLFQFFQARTFGRTPTREPRKRFVSDVRRYIFKDPELADPNLASTNLMLTISAELKIMDEWRPRYDNLIAKPTQSPFAAATAFQVDRLNDLMVTLKHKTALPLMMVAAAHLSSKDFYELVHLIERLFFRVKVICRQKESYLRDLYSEWMRQIYEGNYQFANVVTGAKNLIDRKANDNDFVNSLIKAMQGDENRNYLKYFLLTLDLYTANPSPAQLAIVRSTLSVEHVQPQNLLNDPVAMSQAGINDAEDIQRLGNLCLLSIEENASLSDNPFAAKKAQVAAWLGNGRHLSRALSREVYEHHPANTWTSADISAREQSIANRAKQVFNF